MEFDAELSRKYHTAFYSYPEHPRDTIEATTSSHSNEVLMRYAYNKLLRDVTMNLLNFIDQSEIYMEKIVVTNVKK